ncbi:hypothetical protein RESH_02682 [Rhodopirellula europaea SH398]|jgi:hypothetical protein|uniref:Uncharacterized protein n=1 Tax=Rhodopirellula europaea SH398 TaxID=1263868 RepID=M5SKR2_9BACT|nr:hypothetical protein RESH_02682 [Rhodopirellula europaea SH398]
MVPLFDAFRSRSPDVRLANGHIHHSQVHRSWNGKQTESDWPTANINPNVMS